MSEKLRACPFCSSEDVEKVGGYDGTAAFVTCNKCGADGPLLRRGAVQHWNTRVSDNVMLHVASEIENYGDPRMQWLADLLREEVEK